MKKFLVISRGICYNRAESGRIATILRIFRKKGVRRKGEIMKKGKKAKGLFKEFKAFIMRGNVLELAVAVIIGGAFTAIVTSVTNDLIMPLINLAMGGMSLAGQNLVLNGEPRTLADGSVNPACLTWNYGNFIQAVINFLIIAIILFLILKLFTTVQRRMDMRGVIQGKLDNDQPLNAFEKKILEKWQKADPETAPQKAEPAPEEPKKPTEAELLEKMCALLEENNELLKKK